MPRMELRGVEEGNTFYYNTEGGGALSGFGTIRLWNTAGNLSIYFNSSNGHVDNAGSNVNIYNDYSNCMIWNGGNNVNIQLTNGISTLITGGNSVRINATGNAPCWNAITGSDISINLDSGDDFVGGGEDGVVTDSTINMGAGNDTVNIGGGGSNININAGENDDFVGLQYTSYTTAYGGNGNDTIFIHDNSSNILANAGAGNDTIWHTSDCSSVTINCGDGDDYVDINTGSSNVTIQSGTGSDRISNGGNDVLIELEGDNNFVKTTGSNVTIRSGAGSDSVNVYAGVMNIPYVFEYADGDGHDVVTKDVQIYLSDSAQVNGFYIEGNDVIYNVGNGSIRILDAASVDINFFINEDDHKRDDNDDIEGEMTGGAAPLTFYNGPELNLDYLKQANVKPENINLEGFLDYCNTEPVLQSIFNESKNSPYLSEYSPEEAEEISKLFNDIYKKTKNLSADNEKPLSDETYKSNLEEISKALDSLSNKLGMLDIAVAYAGETINPAYAIFLNFANIAVKKEESRIAEKKLLKKYPNYKSHDPGYGDYQIYGWQGPAPSGIEIPMSAYEDQLRARDYWVKRTDRENNADMYNKIDELELRKINLEGTMVTAFEGLTILGIGALLGASALEIAVVGGLATVYVNGLTAYKKSKYLQEVHQDE